LETQAAKPAATAKEAIAATIGRSSEISMLYLQCLYVVNINHQAKIFTQFIFFFDMAETSFLANLAWQVC
jgi:hypothetical protein